MENEGCRWPRAPNASTSGSGGSEWQKKGFQLWIDEFEEKRSTDMTDIDNLNVWNCVEM